MSTSSLLTPTIPTEADSTLAKRTKQLLAPRISAKSPLNLRALDLAKKPTIQIPAPAARLLVQILDEMSKGNAVKLIPVRPELTTQEAADLLHISRPTLIQLLDEGKIEYRKVGTHRRVPIESITAYKRELHTKRKAALAQLTAYDQEIGL